MTGRLVLTRNYMQAIYIRVPGLDAPIKITPTTGNYKSCKIAIEAPAEVRIHREEIKMSTDK